MCIIKLYEHNHVNHMFAGALDHLHFCCQLPQGLMLKMETGKPCNCIVLQTNIVPLICMENGLLSSASMFVTNCKLNSMAIFEKVHILCTHVYTCKCVYVCMYDYVVMRGWIKSTATHYISDKIRARAVLYRLPGRYYINFGESTRAIFRLSADY